MKTLTLNIPESVDVNDNELILMLSANLYEIGKLSLGQAAEMAGLSKSSFMDMLGLYNISLFNFPASEIANDVRNA